MDELGVVALRLGSEKQHSSALPYGDVHSLYSEKLDINNVTRNIRLAVIDHLIYRDHDSNANPANWHSFAELLQEAIEENKEASFGSYLSQVLITRGARGTPNTTHYKYDTETVRNWGIVAPSSAPTITIVEPDGKTFASCNSTESPVMTSNEGTQTFANDRDSVANAATQIVADSTTFRGTSTKTFASAQDFTVYDAAQTGSDDDIIEMYVFVSEPQNLDTVTLMIDVENGDFTQDYYYFTWKNTEEIIETRPEIPEILAHEYDVEGQARRQLEDRIETRKVATTTFRPDKDSWNYLSISRGQFSRVGGTANKNWSTVLAVRVSFQGSAALTCRFDAIRIIGGNTSPLKGDYVWRYIYAYDNGTYVAKSPPSGKSTEVTLENRGARVNVTASSDPQTTRIWLFRMGGLLDSFYRVADLTNTSGDVLDNFSDEDALRVGIALETDNVLPPDNIISIAGPHADRLFALTKTHLYPSRRRNPDSFSNGQVIRIGDDTERCYWLAKTFGGLYVGTSKDIYRIDGDGSEHPDGTVDLRKTNLNIPHPPISRAFAQQGDVLCYLAADGWRLFTGQGSASLSRDTELLYKGYTRWLVSPVNISNLSSKFKAAIGKNQLLAITPEGTNTIKSTVIYRYDFAKQRWYRHVYPFSMRAITRQPDGSILVGSDDGFIHKLDSGLTDTGAYIPITVWTINDNDGTPENKKDADQYFIHLNTGGQQATVNFHTDESVASQVTLSPTGNEGATTFFADLTALPVFRAIHQRITGSFNTFLLYEYAITYRIRPRTRLVWDTGPAFDQDTDFIWLRQFRLKAIAASNLTVTPYFEDIAEAAQTITVSAGRTRIYPVYLGRSINGRLLRFRVTSTSQFEPYWIQIFYRASGNITEKKSVILRAEL